MDYSHVLNMESYGVGGFIQNVSILSAIPKDFTVKYAYHERMEADPDTPKSAIIEKLSDDRLLQFRDGEDEVRFYFLDSKNRLIFIDFGGRHLDCTAYSAEDNVREAVTERMEKLKGFKLINKAKNGLWIDVCYLVSSVEMKTEFIAAPEWDTIRNNYPNASEIEEILSMERPWEHGRILVWYGPPGTGKTYAIRSLMMKWRDKFNFVVVADPERLTANPSYYYQVASRSSDRPDGKQNVEQEITRTLFVLEDSADMIMPESRSSHYDKVNKFLNITDGIVGQGREDIFLITFNEPEASIDPAFMRPGRCISKIEFPDITPQLAERWLKARGVPVPEKMPTTLAELYALTRKRINKPDEIPSIGFKKKIIS